MAELAALPGRCEEASPLSTDHYIPCNAPAARVIYSPTDDREFRMCLGCASHSVKSRGMEDRGAFEGEISSPPIGDNTGTLPYDPAVFDQHNTKTREWLDVAGEWLKAGEITTEEQANKLKEWLDGAKPLQDAVEAARRAELVPYEGKIAGVNKAYTPLVDGWKSAINGLKPILGAFVLRERERKEKERQAREAAAAKQLEDAKREAARAEESGDFIGQAEAAKTLKAAEKTAKAAARPVKAAVGSGVGNGRAVAVTRVKTVIIDDIDLAFLEVRNDPRVVDAIQSALNAIVRSKEWGEGRRLRGAHVEEKEAVR